MKVYWFDIWGGDKGIIFAENDGQAYELYHKKYKNPIYEVDTDEDYDEGICNITCEADVPNEPKVVVIEEAW